MNEKDPINELNKILKSPPVEIILPDNLDTEENKSFFMLFHENNLEMFFDDYAKDFEQDDESSMLDIYYISDILNDFVHTLFTSIIQSSLDKEEYPAHLGTIIEIWDAWYKRIKNNCARLIDKLPPEGKKKQLTEKMGEILQICKKIDSQTEHKQIIPDYINQLIENGYIETDGKTAIASLDKIAEFLYSLNLDEFNFKTLLQFCQHDGRPFSENSAKEAVKRANHTE